MISRYTPLRLIVLLGLIASPAWANEIFMRNGSTHYIRLLAKKLNIDHD